MGVVKKKQSQEQGGKRARGHRRSLEVCLVASESVPLVKVGGLADVVGSLAKALWNCGVDVCVVLPWYKRQISSEGIEDIGIKITSPVGSEWIESNIYRKRVGNIDYFLIDCPKFFDRDGIYGDVDGDYLDNLERYSYFCKVVLELLLRLKKKWDVIHCNDWQTGLLPVFYRAFEYDKRGLSGVKFVFGVHNLMYQGLFAVEKFYLLGIPWSYFTYHGIEFYGKLNCLKAGLVYSDKVVTVSPTYAKEIQMPEYGYGLDGVLRSLKDRLVGILNGIDYDIWDPMRDPFLDAKYGVRGNRLYFKGKIQNRYGLVNQLNLRCGQQTMFIAMVSRLVEQKGIDIAVGAMDKLLSKGMELCFVVLGLGERRYVNMLKRLERKYPERVRCIFEFNEELAHKLYGSADVVLIPSRFEPCGLTQMIGMRYGCLPIARRTGGLIDSIPPDIGFLFDNTDINDLISSIENAVGVFALPGEWKKRVKSAMRLDFSWKASARKYVKLYKNL